MLRRADRTPILVGHEPAPRLDVGPVHRQRCKRPRQLVDPAARVEEWAGVQFPPDPLDVGLERARGLLELRRQRDLPKAPPIA